MATGGIDPEKRLAEASAHFAAGRYADAARAFADVIETHPDIPELHLNRGAALKAAGRMADAETSYRRAIELAPDNGMAWFNLANLYGDAGRKSEALAALERAHTLLPHTPEVLNNLGAARYASGDVEGAVTAYRAALERRPGFADALTNLGNALQRLCRMDEAKTALEQALAAAPAHPVFLLNMSGFLAANGHTEEALEWAERSIAMVPDYVEARLKKASLLIQLGRLEEGFTAYEDRWRKPGWHRLAGTLRMPAWRGEPLDGKRLLVWNEQGYGDAILHARYLPMLLAEGADVTFLAEPPLHRLIAESLPVRVADISAPAPDADFHVSNMSLPYLCKTALATIPADVPYLRAPSGTDAWKEKVETAAKGRFRVGLAWAGNPGQAHDYSRSMPTAALAPLLDVPDVAFFNLLVGPRGDEIKHPNVLDLRNEIKDFGDSAGLMQSLDLVVSVDSAPAHLAGALGKPVWILLAFDPDSRYFLDRTDSPWYPTAKLYRQRAPGAWADPVAEAARDLAALARKKTGVNADLP